MGPRDIDALPFPLLYGALASNGAKGGATKYLTLQFLNYARWTAQENSCGFAPAIRLMINRNMWGANGNFQPFGIMGMWRPAVTLLNESVHWAIKVPVSLSLYETFKHDLGSHGGLFAGVALNSCLEVALTGPTERFGVHMAINKEKSYRRSLEVTRQFRPNLHTALWNGASGLWVRNFSWNFTFFEWKRVLHNALDRPGYAFEWAEPHFMWLRKQDPKNAANILTFEAACFATYLTFFNMAGDNVKTKMSAQPEQFPTVRYTVKYIYEQHGIVGFTRGSLFKGIYLVAGATIAIGIQERLTEIMSKLLV